MKIEIDARELQALIDLAARAQKSQAEVIFIENLVIKAEAQLAKKQE